MPLTDDNISGLRIKSDEKTVTVLAVIQSDKGAVALLDDGSFDFVGNVRDSYDVTNETDETPQDSPASSDPTTPSDSETPGLTPTTPAGETA